MIEYIGRDGPPEAKNCPAFICDHCREQVVGSGNVTWCVTFGGGERSSPIYVSHKQCARSVEAWLETIYPRRDGWMVLWDEMRIFVQQLAYNASHAFADDAEGTYRSHSLALPTEP